jgi:subtilisin family serine protease
MEIDPVTYFLPRQLMLQIEHPAGMEPSRLQEVILVFLKNSDHAWSQGIELQEKPDFVTFPIGQEGKRSFSLVRAQTKISEIELLNEIKKQLGGKPLEMGSDVWLQRPMLNWLAGGANGQSGTGGPGSWPVPATAPATDGGNFWHVRSDGTKSALPASNGKGQGIHVAILDTMPSIHDLDAAYARWHGRHHLVDELLGPGSPLRLYPASYDDLYETQGFDLMGHRYLMPDHGLFIAGIIHTIAPRATLHLYEVLNPYGVGSLDSIARGLQRVLDNPEIGDHTLIINCSFMLGIPPGKVEDPKSPLYGLDPAEMAADAWVVFEPLVKRSNIILVAAAGNEGYQDANNNPVRPPTRYPAAYEQVVGVGATPRPQATARVQFSAASYSNLSDTPTAGSYITLGGEPGSENGVRGIFTGGFPFYEEPIGCLATLLGLFGLVKIWKRGHLPSAQKLAAHTISYRPNGTGWAWWAGTSFATPIVSGMLAEQGRLDYQNVLDPAQSGTIPSGEKVILVQQG